MLMPLTCSVVWFFRTVRHSFHKIDEVSGVEEEVWHLTVEM